MTNLILEIKQSYEKKIDALQKEIERLQTKKNMIISSLKEDIGDVKVAPAGTAQKTTHNGEATIHDRLIDALDSMPSAGFKTADLIRAVEMDRYGKAFDKKRASKVLQDLCVEGVVRIIKPRVGNVGRIYQKNVDGQGALPYVPRVRTIPPSSVSAVKRIQDALDSLEGEFSSAELLTKASNDGRGEKIPITSFYPKFSKLVKEGIIITISRQSGGIPGRYIRAEKKTAELFPTLQDDDQIAKERGGYT